ncbi:hypothetical protein ACF1YR_000339 [Escherichia coli]
MKQMSLIEMDGFLKGKCIPRDLKVNETNAEYLVRKFGELESKTGNGVAGVSSAGITIDNLEAKCAALAEENAGLNKFIKDDCWIWDDKSEEYFDAADCMPETPATDAFLAEMRAQGVELAISQAFRDVTPVNRMQFISRMTAFAAQLRKGGNQ